MKGNPYLIIACALVFNLLFAYTASGYFKDIRNYWPNWLKALLLIPPFGFIASIIILFVLIFELYFDLDL